MKKTYLIFAMAVLILLLFSGCKSGEVSAAQEISSDSEITTTTHAIATPASVITTPTSVVVTPAAAQVTKAATEPSVQKPVAPEPVTSEPAAANMIVDNFYITINVSTNMLTMINVSGEAIAAYPVATGEIVNGISRTPTGQFSVFEKIIDRKWNGAGYADPIPGGDPRNPLGHYWMGIAVPGNAGIGLHGNIDESSIGKSVSHGCIRMHNYEVSLVFDAVSVGTVVWIGTTQQLTDWGAVNFQ